MIQHEPLRDARELGRFAGLYQVLDDAIAARAFPGCAFGVLAGNRVLLEDSRGRFTYEPDSPPVAPETVFDLASVSKVVATTAAVMLLVQRGQLNLDDLLGDWLPAFVEGRPRADAARAISLRHLLSHSSGLPGYVEFFRTCSTPQMLLEACLRLPVEAAPGSRAEYSDPGFILLGQVLERCVGEPLDRWTRREIFAPLQLASTGFRPPAGMRPLIPPAELIPPTEEDRSFRRRRIQGEVQDENAFVLQGVAGHAGLFSNVPNLLQFCAALLHAHSAGEAGAAHASLFHRETIRRFAERQAPEGSSRALGWDTPSDKSSSGDYFSRHSIGHLGYSGCSLWIDLETEIAIVLLTNRTWPDRGSQLIKQVRPAFHNAARLSLRQLP